MLFLASKVLVYISLFDEGRVFTLEYIFILKKRSRLVRFKLSVLVCKRHALVLSHRPGHHLLHTFHTLGVSFLLAAVLNEEFRVALVQSFKLSD